MNSFEAEAKVTESEKRKGRTTAVKKASEKLKN